MFIRNLRLLDWVEEERRVAEYKGHVAGYLTVRLFFKSSNENTSPFSSASCHWPRLLSMKFRGVWSSRNFAKSAYNGRTIKLIKDT